MELEKIIEDQLRVLELNGTVENIVRKSLEKLINEAVEDTFGWRSPVKESITKKLEEAMVPAIENRNWNQYIPKLDAILTEILSMDNLAARKKILENFKELSSEEPEKEVMFQDIFDKYREYAASDVNTDDLEVVCDDQPSYQYIDVNAWFEITDKRSFWSDKSQYGILHFKCEQDEDLNRQIELENYNDTGWKVNERFNCDIRSLRTLDTFSIYILRLSQAYSKIDVEDGQEMEDEIEPDAKPEATWG